MPDPDPTDDELRVLARNLFAPEADDAEPDESDEPDDDTRITRNLFA